MQRRDAHGRFISAETWALAYALSGRAVPKRVGVRNAVAPLSLAEITSASRRAKRVRTGTRQMRPTQRTERELVQPAQRKRAVAKKPAARPALEKVWHAGQEAELTVRYKASTRKALHVKVRVRLEFAMTDAQALALATRGLASGNVPAGIQIAAIDWERGTESGGYDDPEHQVLRDFGRLVNAAGASLRFAKASEEEEV